MSELKVQFGCGSNILDGWRNHDSDANICGRLPYNDNVVDFILIEHCLEHVNCADGFRFLKEAHRILKPGGTLRVCVPMALEMPTVEHCVDLLTGHGHQTVYDRQILRGMLQIAGFKEQLDSGRKDCDGHWRVIGMEKDDLETLRMEGIKP
jgi:predicted SAM-dependent methyltransferase